MRISDWSSDVCSSDLKDDKTPGIEGLGYSPEHLAEFERMRQNAEGIVIFAGPTGHGKSTSMARNLARQIEEHRNTKTTLTVEDPPAREDRKSTRLNSSH